MIEVFKQGPGFENAEKEWRPGNSHHSKMGGKDRGEIMETAVENGGGANRMVVGHWFEGLTPKAEESGLRSASQVRLIRLSCHFIIFYVFVWVPERTYCSTYIGGTFLCHMHAGPVETRRLLDPPQNSSSIWLRAARWVLGTNIPGPLSTTGPLLELHISVLL